MSFKYRLGMPTTLVPTNLRDGKDQRSPICWLQIGGILILLDSSFVPDKIANTP